jgi:predicted MPP superfamily phosphohydrolase
MKNILFKVLVAGSFLSAYTQEDTALYIFIGHPRSDDRDHQHVLETVEKIDYSKYELILLGGDLTWNTSQDRSTLQYCDSIFNLGDKNTHLAIGNHDLDNAGDLLEFTKKPRFYAFSNNNITFLVLDTEISTPDITGDQLELIQNVVDTIEKSDYLVLLQHRILWMVGVDELSHLMDSVAASTRNLNSSNFYDDVYPNLQKARNNGVEVLCLAGDRTDINIEYSPEDSIQFVASGMVGTFSDEENFAILLTHNPDSGKLGYDFIALSEIDTIASVPPSAVPETNVLSEGINIYPNPVEDILHIYSEIDITHNVYIELLDVSGVKITGITLKKGFKGTDINITDFSPGVYIIRITDDSNSITRKILKVN